MISYGQIVSEFTIDKDEKSTPTTNISPQPTRYQPCYFCKDHLAKVTELRKREILMELLNEELKEEVQKLKRQKEQLIHEKILTYNQYQRKLDAKDLWNRQDLEAQIFEARIIIELLLNTKEASNHPKIKQIDSQSVNQKYANLLLDHLRLQEKLMIRDRIIEQKVFYPIYHYDQRVTTLRKAMLHWYHKAEVQCAQMKKRCKDLKQNFISQTQNMRQLMNKELEYNKNQLSKLVAQATQLKSSKDQRVCKKNKVSKDSFSRAQLKKLR